MKRLATMCLAVAPIATACSIYDFEGMALVNPEQAIVVGDTVSMVVVDDQGGMPARSSVLWSTSDSSIATVDELGLVHGTGPGVTRIRAVTRGYRLTVDIKVWATARLATVTVGAAHACGLSLEGRALCWGSNLERQLGVRRAPNTCETPAGNFPCSTSAYPVDSDQRFTALAGGYYHACGLTADGSAHCWGTNDAGQLGDGTTTTRPEPDAVPGGHAFRSLAAGGRTTCGITEDDRLLCWGESRSMTLGDADRATPAEIAPTIRFDRVAIATTGEHICGIATTGATLCWGSNRSGQLGVDDVPPACPIPSGQYPCTADPVEVAAPTLERLVLGNAFTCGRTGDGEAFCWGQNDRGQLGDGTTTDGWQPRAVVGGHAFSALSAGQRRACGVSDARLWCWGFDQYDFGNGGGRDGTEALEPIRAGGGLGLADVSVGPSRVCGIGPDAVTWCWGSGLLGNGAFDTVGGPIEPVRVVLYDPSR